MRGPDCWDGGSLATADGWGDDRIEERRARVELSRYAEPCDSAVARLLASVGAVETAARIRSGLDGFERLVARVRGHDTDRLLAIADRVGARVVIPGDDEWPTGLDDLAIPPWCIWVRGPVDLADFADRSVALVGSRDSTAYGENVAAELGARLAARDWTVVSGAALGIDAAAHRGALSVSGPTIAFLAGGVERPYPASNAGLLSRIAEEGAVVSEIPPGSAPFRSRFLLRNRLIAAVSRGTVVIEADLRSGSRNTVKHAADLARPVGAVPGPITSITSGGCHQEIRDGRATLVTSPEDIIELVGRIGDDLSEPARGEVLPTDGLEPDEARVHEALPVRALTDVDRLAQVTGMLPARVRGVLGRLEVTGLAEAVEGRWRKASPPRASDADPSPHSLAAERERKERARKRSAPHPAGA